MSNFKRFRDFKPEDQYIGGKAYVLSQLIQQDLPVPDGAVLSEVPVEDEWSEVLDWWKEIGNPPLAVRSSALGEDSGEFSYAGQQKTYLNVKTPEELKEAVSHCFRSTDSVSSKAYRQHFSQAVKIKMNVVLQQMVDAKLAGVFFSQDPRASETGWLIECVEGLGEKLVSGQVTPDQIKESGGPVPAGWRAEWTRECVAVGKKCEEFLQAPVDAEWAIDQSGRFFLLQARPITVSAKDTQKPVEEELTRLKQNHAPTTVWDGQTFAEWTGAPTELTFSVWAKAFSAQGAFAKALHEVGYLAAESDFSEPLLERVFGRAYINLERLAPLFFGDIPYRIVSKPRPHLIFDSKKLNARVIFNTPKPLWRMIKVGWKLKTQRLETIDKCQSKLNDFKKIANWPVKVDYYSSWSDAELMKHFKSEATRFSQETLFWPFVLTVMIEATLQSLQMMLNKIEGEEKAKTRIQSWMSHGLHTVTEEMSQAFGSIDPGSESEQRFFADYGHRGPGEMDLGQERWVEWTRTKFRGQLQKGERSSDKQDIEKEISTFGSFRAPVILQDWQLLEQMLMLREQWKMQIMRPYAHLRWMALELGRRTGLNQDVFWLSVEEIDIFENVQKWQALANSRRRRAETLRKISLPAVVDLETIENWLTGKIDETGVIQAEGISVGVTTGTVVHVEDYQNVVLDSLPADFILVASATDPGWTPLFRRAKAIVVENGGILSHCAIVAREMGIPAITGVDHVFDRLPAGRKVWIDGTHGRISFV